MDTLPIDKAAIDACDDLRRVHVVAVAHPSDEISAAAAAREQALPPPPGSKHKMPPQMHAFRAAARADSGDKVTFSDGAVLPASECRKYLMSNVAADRALAFAASRTVAPSNAATLAEMRAWCATAAAEEGFASWSELQAHGLGFTTHAVRAMLDDYAEANAAALARELAQRFAVTGGEAPHMADASWLVARLSSAPAAAATIPFDAALAAVAELYRWLGCTHVEVSTQTWCGVAMHVVDVTAPNGARGAVWLDAFTRATKRVARGMTSRFATRDADNKGGAYVTLCLPVDAPLPWSAVRSLVHEMGHGLHQALTARDVESLTPYVEVPSTLLERLVCDRAVADAVGLGAVCVTTAAADAAHQVAHDVATARYALDLFSSADAPVRYGDYLAAAFPAWRDAGVGTPEHTLMPLASLQSAYYLYLVSDAAVEALLPQIAAREPVAMGRLWRFMTEAEHIF